MKRGSTALAAACVLTVAACSSGSSKPKSTPTTSTAPREHVVTAKQASAALLGHADVGKSLVRDRYEPPLEALYCEFAGAPTLAKATSATDIVGVLYTSTKPQATVQEDVYLYKSSAEARAAMTSMQDGMDCATGHVANASGSGTPVSVGPTVDYLSRLSSAASSAYGWTLRIADQGGIQFGIVVRTTLIVIKYLLSTSALNQNGSAPNFPDAVTLARTAVDHASTF